MKKRALIITIAIFVIFIGTQVFACPWDGYWGGHGCGPAEGFYADNAGNYQDFYNDTARLRKDIAAKKREYHSIMSSENPDPQKSEEISREIKELHDQLRAKARSYGLQTPPDSNYNHRGNYHHGGHRGGYGCRW